MKKRVFIASGSDLTEERKKLKELLYDEGFEPVLWEDIDHSITNDEFQTRINDKHLRNSDIIIFMIKSKLGKFTKEEFDFVYNKLSHDKKKMYIYIFPGDTNNDDFEELSRIDKLKKQLKEDGQYWIPVKNILELKNHFLMQIKHINKEFKEEEKKSNICNNDTHMHMKILLTISILISTTECNKHSICIEYQELKNKLIENNFDEKDIYDSLAFLLVKGFLDKGKMIDNDGLNEIEYIKLLSKASKIIIQQSELLKQIKEDIK